MGARDLLASLPVGKIRVDLTVSTVATNAYTDIAASFPAPCSAISVGYTGKAILILAKGAAGLEVDLPLYLTPGMNHEMLIPLNLAKLIRFSMKALDQAVSSGELVINLYG